MSNGNKSNTQKEPDLVPPANSCIMLPLPNTAF